MSPELTKPLYKNNDELDDENNEVLRFLKHIFRIQINKLF